MWMPQTSLLLAQALPRDEESFVTELAAAPEGWAGVLFVVVLLAILIAVVWMYRHEGRAGSTLRRRLALAGLRCVVLAGLAVILLEPVRVRMLRRWIDSYTIVLIDQSSSMDLSDSYMEADERARIDAMFDGHAAVPISRIQIAQRVLTNDNRALLRQLTSRNRVKVFGFSDKPTLVGTLRRTDEAAPGRIGDSQAPGAVPISVDDLPLTLDAVGASTNLQRAIHRTVESVGGAPIAAIVVVSDGGFNRGDPVDRIASFAQDRQIPIHVIGIGDPTEPINVRVAEVSAPDNVLQDDPFVITARITASGIQPQRLRVNLRQRTADSGSEGKIVDSTDVEVGADDKAASVTFRQIKRRTGAMVYSVEVPHLPREAITDDNQKQTNVNIVDAQTRVLIVAGRPSWDYRLLLRLLQRDHTFDVSTWLQSADHTSVRDGNTIIDHFPSLPEELFAYDLIILMDVNPADLDAAWCAHVDTMVTEHGGGLLMCAARGYTPKLFRQPSLDPLIDLLPITPDPAAELVLNQIGHYQLRAAPIEVPDAAISHPVMRLTDDPAGTRLTWRSIGEVYWHFPVLREKPAATVLMRHGGEAMQNRFGKHVLAATQFVGAGRTGFVAFDGTYRWRRQSRAAFERFWIQFARHVAGGKLLGGSRRGLLLVESDQASLGQSVRVSARVFDSRYQPLTTDIISAQVGVGANIQRLTLHARRGQPGWFDGQFIPDRTGTYQIALDVPGGGGEDPTRVACDVLVSRPNIEVRQPEMNREMMRRLASGTPGGRYFHVDEVSQLPSAISDLHEEVTIRSRPTALWDNASVMVLLAALLSMEWAARKWSHML